MDYYEKEGRLDSWGIMGRAGSMSLKKAKAEYSDPDTRFFVVEIKKNFSNKTSKVRVMDSGNDLPKTGDIFGLVIDRYLSTGGDGYVSKFGKVVEDDGSSMPLYYFD